jgi:hypothetical protein
MDDLELKSLVVSPAARAAHLILQTVLLSHSHRDCPLQAGFEAGMAIPAGFAPN